MQFKLKTSKNSSIFTMKKKPIKIAKSTSNCQDLKPALTATYIEVRQLRYRYFKDICT